ncbi:MAG: hypothetical protein JO320_15830 [Alphaproteobacteria bacterium]|nr:hypothetical protein [Alphaproteobacteria bacterium]MBV9814756.1 hypothetical protein [Alphaproteobacteria bacterium]
MSRTHGLAEKRSGGPARSVKSAETGVSGGDPNAEIAPLAAAAAGGDGAPLAIVGDLAAIQGAPAGQPRRLR